jgi:hypothetical protein
MPDIHNYSWRDWGNRVGVWHILDFLNEKKIPVGAALNTSCYTECSELIEALRKRGDEVFFHYFALSFYYFFLILLEETKEVIH